MLAAQYHCGPGVASILPEYLLRYLGHFLVAVVYLNVEVKNKDEGGRVMGKPSLKLDMDLCLDSLLEIR